MLRDNECLVIVDFYENYHFIIQDAIQGYHWDNSQATIHPFIIYTNKQSNPICLAVISECMQHTTAVFYAFQSCVIKEIKNMLPEVNKIIYFSDGCAAQYKNKKTFAYILHHKKDFNLDCE